MGKPYLIVVTGRPGSGKTTFARALGDEIFMPVISRDQIKEGYVHTAGRRHSELDGDTNRTATDIFFATVTNLLHSGVSVIAEAAFQHAIWAKMLAALTDDARLYLIVCTTDGAVALDRFLRRGLGNPLREYFHGDWGVDLARRGVPLEVSPYEEPRLNAPTFHVDTTGEYDPPIRELAGRILGRE